MDVEALEFAGFRNSSECSISSIAENSDMFYQFGKTITDEPAYLLLKEQKIFIQVGESQLDEAAMKDLQITLNYLKYNQQVENIYI